MAEQQPPDRSADQPADQGPSAGDRDAEWRRRRRLAEVFGDVLPETTADERDAGAASDAAGTSEETPQERWLRRQVPPHHG